MENQKSIVVLLDSSNVLLSVGLAKDGVLFDSVSYEAWQRQSELMVDELDKLLDKHHISRDMIKSVVTAKGPGSYTGVRISLSIAKTIAFALNIPLYAISSLQAMKKGQEKTICLINARSGRSYIGVYEGQDCLLEDQVMKNDDVNKYINAHQDYVISGELSYLDKKGYESNTLVEMLSLIDKIKPVDDKIMLKPSYLKDEI